ncbi:MAG: tetratricopeptide repeat protein [Candidatus Latescibacteria bacterium]|nr:tetratricopeptide repeat protein [Candidatus Latescibacterota bacterium]
MNPFRHRRLLLTAALMGTLFGGHGSSPRSSGAVTAVSSSEAQGWAQTGQAFLQKARETGDPTYYTRAEAVFKKALGLDPRNVEAMGGMGSLSLSRHQFREALAWGEQARAIHPSNATLYGIVGDACVELGDYPKAVETLQKMVDLRPGLSAYSRISYLRELMGDPEGAILAMQMAVDAGGPNAENTAWCVAQLGNLYWGRGDLRLAEAQYQRALVRAPDYAPALAGLARVRAAQGDFAGAAALYEQAFAAMPEHAFVEALGDVYRALGRPGEASRKYGEARALLRTEEANGADVDLEMALLEADHDMDLKDALARARREMTRRPSNIHAADALAWALYKAGDFGEALPVIRQALRLGTEDAHILFHAGMIAYRAGEREEGRAHLERALAINPHFSIRYADEAASVLRTLGEGGVSGEERKGR